MLLNVGLKGHNHHALASRACGAMWLPWVPLEWPFKKFKNFIIKF